MDTARAPSAPLSERVVANLLDQNDALRREVAELRQKNALLQQKLAQVGDDIDGTLEHISFRPATRRG